VATGDIGLVRELIELQAPARRAPLEDRRRQYDRAEKTFGKEVPPGERIDAGGCAAEWVLAQEDPAQPVVIYIHGGGYSLGSTRSHRHLAASIGLASSSAVLSLDYRRAPEAQFPAAVDDTVAATRWLLERAEAAVILAGDSAGGGLVLAAMIALRDADLPLPGAGVCLSPWADLTCRADAYTRLVDRDPLLNADDLKRMAADYLGATDSRHRLASPALAKLTGLPPLLIQAGSEEILLDGARSLAQKAQAEGVDVTLQEWPGMIHVWQWYFPVLAEGREAIAAIGSFVRRQATRKPIDDRLRNGVVTRTAAASLTQEAHMLVAPWTAGRGHLSWVYQLNGRLDAQALTRAVDDVVHRHEILRVRLQPSVGHMQQILTPYRPGTLDRVDLSHLDKRKGLDAAIEDVRRIYQSLSPAKDPRFRATLYSIDRKTSVLAMFVAEALVDSDSGSLLSAEITRAYAEHVGVQAPAHLPQGSSTSYLDYIAAHPPEAATMNRDYEHWATQALDAPPLPDWLDVALGAGGAGSHCAFQLAPAEWDMFAAHARRLRVTPYVLALTCLQIALARTSGLDRFLVHSIVSRRDEPAKGVIGNFQSLTRINLCAVAAVDLHSASAATATAVAEAVEHSAFPAPLADAGALMSQQLWDPLPGIRFYMFTSHEGPTFDGVRRRRFRLHSGGCAPLSVSCIFGHAGRQDFVLTSAGASQICLDQLTGVFREVIDGAISAPSAQHTLWPPGAGSMRSSHPA
jgi:phosphinothricin tripeptide acetyl hydrolase